MYEVTVDYGQSLDALVAEFQRIWGFRGDCDFVHDKICGSNFPSPFQGQQAIEIELIQLDAIWPSQIPVKLAEQGFRSTIPHEFISALIRYPDWMQESPIICGDGVYQDADGDKDILYLWSDGSRRCLNFTPCNAPFSKNCRFAAVRISS